MEESQPDDDAEWQVTRAQYRPGAIEEWQATRHAEPEHDAVAGGDEWQPTRALDSSQRRDSEPGHRSEPDGAGESPYAWESTRAQTALATQFLDDEASYLAGPSAEIGRQIGGNERELFVSCAPAEALQQQFEHLHPEFIVVHDIGTTSSRKLLAGIAAASGRVVQRLVVRRQGYGTALATLEFVELPTADNQSLRLYTTEVETESGARADLTRTLLAYSRLAVLMVGEMPGHAIAAALKPLRDAILAGPWLNRTMLILPLASASSLVTHGLDLARGTGVAVRTTPQVTRPADAWAFITGTWSRLRDQTSSGGRRAPELGAFKPNAYRPGRPPASTGMPPGDTRPMPEQAPETLTLHAMPELHVATAVPPATLIERYVAQISDLNGVVSCCVFDISGGTAIAHGGANPGGAELSAHGSQLLLAMMNTSRALGFGHAMAEAAITLGSHHLLLRAVPRNPGLAMHAVLDKASANLTLARLQILRMDALFDERQGA